MSRICITGGPKTGKTTLTGRLFESHETCRGLHCPRIDGSLRDGHRCGEPCHTDDLIGSHDWSEASQAVSEWFDAPGPWIIEGVVVSRALRKWRDQHPGQAPPVDRVIFLYMPYEPLSKGQNAMAKGVATVHEEIESWLRQHGIRTEYGDGNMTAPQDQRSSMSET